MQPADLPPPGRAPDPVDPASVLDAVPDPVVFISLDHRLSPVNEAARILVAERAGADGTTCYEILHGRDRPCRGSCPLLRALQTGEATTLEHRHRRTAGALRTVEIAASPLLRAGRPAGVVAAIRDITGRARRERRLAQQVARARDLASRDPLTGLLHRNAFLPILDRAIDRVDRHGGLVAVGFLDVDDFKGVNDRHGHEVGDALLLDLAARLCQGVRASDVIARLGGDEFAVLLEDFRAPEDVAALGRDLLADLCSGSTRIGELVLPLRASLGLAVYPIHADRRSGLLREADQAMYQAKRAGGCRLALPGPHPEVGRPAGSDELLLRQGFDALHHVE